jgi:hypothetical protein
LTAQDLKCIFQNCIHDLQSVAFPSQRIT